MAKNKFDGKTGKIEQRHIDEGVLGHSSRCALALALAEMFSVPPAQIMVDGVSVGVYDAGPGEKASEIVGMDLSKSVSVWIGVFDTGEEVHPVNLIIKSDERQSSGYLLDIL